MAALNVETLTAPAVAEPTTPIKPSEALRLGRLVRPVGLRGGLVDGDDAACALGAMLAGIGLPSLMVKEEFPELRRTVTCPSYHCDLTASIADIVGHLNDFHLYTDDQIVAWLQSLGL